VIVGVTGTGTPFPRLVDGLAALARSSGERIWVQHGSAQLPAPLEGSSVIARAQLLAMFDDADAVVCHAGCGTLADAFLVGHVPVVVPRRFALGEHVNDHQMELFEALREERRIVGLEDLARLGEAVAEARRRRGPAAAAGARKQALVAALRGEIRELAPRSPSAGARLARVAGALLGMTPWLARRT